MTEAPFWLVWNPDGKIDPQVRYPSRNSATKAARKMAIKCAHDGAYFYVLKAQSCHQMQIGMADFWLRSESNLPQII